MQAGASGNTEGLPIVGVRSRSMENSLRIYQGKDLHHDWMFTSEQNLLGITDETVRKGLAGAGMNQPGKSGLKK